MLASIPSTPQTEADDLLPYWRGVLRDGRAALKAGYEKDGNAVRLLAAHCRLTDHILQALWRQSNLQQACLAAVGGYGRRQVFPYSDIDLVILLPDDARALPVARIERFIATLWDVGLEVGHSVRSVSECVAEAAKDITVETNLREARQLEGAPALFQALRLASEAQLDRVRFFAAKLKEQAKRHARYHETAFNLEPNLKESPGGLRDLQTILWLSDAAGIGSSWSDLALAEIITAGEARKIRRQEKTLQDLRVRLHYLAGRREDRLLFDYQTELAHQFQIIDRRNRRAGEIFMQTYYRTAKTVDLLNTILLQNLTARVRPQPVPGPVALSDNFVRCGDLLHARDEELFARCPGAIFESMLLLQQHPGLSGLSAPTLRALWRAKGRIDRAFRLDPRNRARFMEILRQPRGVTDVMRRMNHYGILGRYIPAFGRIVGQMQHDLYHVYTVDEHILKVLRNLRRFAVPTFSHEFPFCSELISRFERVELLYLAGLFHDIAKGRGGDHSHLGAVDAGLFCKQHGLSEADCALVAWLVDHHLTMSATAQKQDLSDPDVIAKFAATVGSERRLVALYLLTVADIRATSPKVWNAWKGKLLEDLFRAAQRHLEGARASYAADLEAKKQDALRIVRHYALQDGVHEALWAQLDETYFQRHQAQEIAWHTRALRGQVNRVDALVRARLSPIGEGIQVLIYAPDQEALFARICGFFERLHYNIVEAKIHTTRQGYALDTFQVLDRAKKPNHYRDVLNYIEFELRDRLQAQAPLEAPLSTRLSRHVQHFPIAPQVTIEATDKGDSYLLSLTASDRPGLLYRVARVFVQHGVRVHDARVNTLGERVEDTFLIAGAFLADPKASARLADQLIAELRT